MTILHPILENIKANQERMNKMLGRIESYFGNDGEQVLKPK